MRKSPRHTTIPPLLTTRARHHTIPWTNDDFRTLTEVDVLCGGNVVVTICAHKSEIDGCDADELAYNVSESAQRVCEKVEDIRRVIVNHNSFNTIPQRFRWLVGYKMKDGYRIRCMRFFPLSLLVAVCCLALGILISAENEGGAIAWSIWVLAQSFVLGFSLMIDTPFGLGVVKHILDGISVGGTPRRVLQSDAAYVGPYSTFAEIHVIAGAEPQVRARMCVADSHKRVIHEFRTDPSSHDDIRESVVSLLVSAQGLACRLTLSEQEAARFAAASQTR